jgi:hypothetical protein
MVFVAQASVAAMDGKAILEMVDKNLTPDSY